MSTIKANNLQIGQSSTATQNFVLAVPASPDGTIKLSRGNQGATTADVLNVDASGNVGIGTSSPTVPLDVYKSSGQNVIAARTGSVQSYFYSSDTFGAVGTNSNHNFGIVQNGAGRMFFNTDGTITAQGNPITNCKTTAKAWVNFDGTGTFSPNPSTTKIRSSYNVSSITKNGTGNYTINFTTAMTDGNYAINASCSPAYSPAAVAWPQLNTNATGTVNFVIATSTGAALQNEPSTVCVAIFGN